MSVLPSVSVYNFRYPTTEELRTYTTQLEDLRQEARNLTQVATSRDVFSSWRYQTGRCELVMIVFIDSIVEYIMKWVLELQIESLSLANSLAILHSVVAA